MKFDGANFYQLKSREEWLKHRLKGIGGSEAAAVLGLSKWLFNDTLYRIKIGLEVPEDISEKEFVKYGVLAEPHLRALFALDNPQFEVIYEENNSYVNKEYPFLLASLDGILKEKATGRFGLYEGKTTNIFSKTAAELWENKIPQNYYMQVLHYFIVIPQLQFAIVNAQMKFFNGTELIKTEIRPYRLERKDYEDDILLLKRAEINFWQNNVMKRVEPARILPEI